jgi:hypothetical protein
MLHVEGVELRVEGNGVRGAKEPHVLPGEHANTPTR